MVYWYILKKNIREEKTRVMNVAALLTTARERGNRRAANRSGALTGIDRNVRGRTSVLPYGAYFWA